MHALIATGPMNDPSHQLFTPLGKHGTADGPMIKMPMGGPNLKCEI